MASARDFYKQHQQDLELLRKVVFDNQLVADQRNERQHNMKVTEFHFKQGDKVLTQFFKSRKGEMKKQCPRYEGAYYVEEVLDGNCLRLRRCEDGKLVKSPVHKNRCRPYYDSRRDFYNRCQFDRQVNLPRQATTQPLLPTQDDVDNVVDNGTQVAPPTPATAAAAADSGQTNPDGWYTLKRIIKHRRDRNKLKFLVEYDDSTTAWLPKSQVTQFAVDAYFRSLGERANKRRRYRRRN
jgi:hypothetical protein